MRRRQTRGLGARLTLALFAAHMRAGDVAQSALSGRAGWRKGTAR